MYVGQVEYSATPEELLAHFEPCGTVERVTIVCDKFTGHPKGFAYLEFQVSTTLLLEGILTQGTFSCTYFTIQPLSSRIIFLYYYRMRAYTYSRDMAVKYGPVLTVFFKNPSFYYFVCLLLYVYTYRTYDFVIYLYNILYLSWLVWYTCTI